MWEIIVTQVAKRSSPTPYCAQMMWQYLNKLFIDCKIHPELSPASGLNSSSVLMVKKNSLWQPLNYRVRTNKQRSVSACRKYPLHNIFRFAEAPANIEEGGEQKFPCLVCSFGAVLLCDGEQGDTRQNLSWCFTQNHQHCEDLDVFFKGLMKSAISVQQ